MATTFQTRFTWFRRMTGMERTLLILGIVFMTLLVLGAATIASMLLHQGHSIVVNTLFAEIDINVLVACISGALLAITLVYQVIQFRISRFQTIFNHQMELHLGLVDKMKYKKYSGNLALKKLVRRIIKRNGNISCEHLMSTDDLINCFEPVMLQYDYMLTPYFRHITSVLTFLKYRSPHSESKVYPDYYLNIFSRCELCFYFFYAVWEQEQIDNRKKRSGGNNSNPRKSETNLRQLFKDIEFDRYFRVAFPPNDPSWQQLYLNFVNS